jgi:hypothetical protein
MKIDVEAYLGLLLKENVSVVLRTFITALAVWMEERAQASNGQIDKFQLIGDYYGYVDRTVAAGHYTRIDAPGIVLPPMSWARVDELAALLNEALRSLPDEEALPFLGELTGAWILSCPASLIHQENELSKNPPPLTTEADLIFSMRRWLWDALMVGQ